MGRVGTSTVAGATAGVVLTAMFVVSCGDPGTAERTQVLRVVMADDWAETAPVVEAVRDFERAHPGVRVDVRGVSFSRIPATVVAARSSREAYDLAQWHPFAAAAQGITEPLDDLWEQFLVVDDFVPGAVEDVMWEGAFHGVPLDTNAMFVLANPDLLDTVGATPRSLGTMRGVRDVAARLAAEGSRVMTWSSSSWVAYGFIRANGGEVVELDDDGTVTFTLDAPEVVEALGLAGEMVAAGEAYPPSQRDNAGTAFDLFRTGATALHATGTWDLAALDGVTDWEPSVLKVPRGPSADGDGTALGGSGLFVPAGAPDRDLAFQFALELIDDETALALAQQEGRLPARRRVFESEFFDTPEMDVVRAALEVARPMKLIAFPEAQEAFAAAIDEILLGRRSAAEALAAAQRTATAGAGASP